MKFGFREREGRAKAGPVTTAVVLLVLTGHAFVVSASHFHRGPQPGGAAASGVARAVRPEGALRSPLAGGHEHCLLCRLQRSLLAELQPSAPTLGAAGAEARALRSRSDFHVRQASLRAPSGRAPPAA